MKKHSKGEILNKIGTVLSTELNNSCASKKYFSQKIISCIFESSYLKPRVARLQESRYCKMGHWLELVLINNLIRDSDIN